MIKEIRAALPGFQNVNGEKVFILRNGVRFGMIPQEVIHLEHTHGVDYDLKNHVYTDDRFLFDSGVNYQLYYDAKGKDLGGLPLFRFEYDFDHRKKLLSQFYYVFEIENKSPYFSLFLALQAKYGAANTDIKLRSTKFKQERPDNTQASSQWILQDGKKKQIIVDLWLITCNTCYLAFQEAGM